MVINHNCLKADPLAICKTRPSTFRLGCKCSLPTTRRRVLLLPLLLQIFTKKCRNVNTLRGLAVKFCSTDLEAFNIHNR